MSFISDPDQAMPRKRLFMGMLCAVCFLVCTFLLLGWIIPFMGFVLLPSFFSPLLGGIFLFFITGIAWSLMVMSVQILWGKSLWGEEFVRGIMVRYYLPCMELLARVIGLSVEELRRSFIKINNHLVLHFIKDQARPKNVLLLLPHCVQQKNCSLRLSVCADTCKQCGACAIGPLQDLAKRYPISLAIASGGTIARKLIKTKQPDFIVAIACERDLASGIQDTHPLPVYGILNHRPEGPCENTQVNVGLVEQLLLSLFQDEKYKMMESKGEKKNTACG